MAGGRSGPKWKATSERSGIPAIDPEQQKEALMAGKLVWGILGGTVLGAAFGQIGGNTGIGIAICIAAGAVAAAVWHYLETRKGHRNL